ncbi:hypothetical protein LOTGIDRAFT_220842 [Lottia gigantea]|uniref:Uncharacterized protein n=1 Tax=Lottia gigantea TaxID=225164 RepID=V3ZPA1_LOTGI|nr:hypothetical protein LOTGIDRAFT_220842 [Lottia gigantea]ESO86167.1 hypothetical protein LOTGIDRAFT_220842 [Lottia gigantea]
MYDAQGDEETGGQSNDFVDLNAFDDKNVRLGFIRKVYAILCIQLCVTMCIMSLFLFIDPVRIYSQHNPWIWYLAMVLTIIILIVLACCSDVRRQYPLNMILLGAFTCCEGVLLGAVASHYEAVEVIIAVGVTAIVVLGLTIFAFQTKWDFTMWGGILFVFLIVLFCFGILALIFQNKIVNMVYSCLGALLFSFYLVFDTQLMLGGKHKYSLSPEEYIFAALNLYLDVVNLFLFILSIVGNVRR